MLLKSITKIKITYLTLVLAGAAISTTASADIHPQGASLSYSQKSLSNYGNPAVPALIIERDDPHVITGAMLNIGSDLEYGNFDDLFEKINELANEFKPPSDGNSGDGSDGEGPDNDPDGDFINWADLFEQHPNLEGKIGIVKGKVFQAAALLAIIGSEGYGKAEANVDGSFILSEDIFGGSLLLGFGVKGRSKALGIFEQPNFDIAQAKEQLAAIPNFQETDPIQALELSGGITLFYNPANNKTKLMINNDSLLLIKAMKISQISLNYSQKMLTNKYGDFYWGIKPTYYRVGLANVSARLGDINDSEALFDDIKNADFIYKNGFDFDLGLIWAAEHYQFGASLTNVIEKSFSFPELDRSSISSQTIISQLDHHKSVTLERQLRLEAGIYTKQRKWSLHAEVDANAITDNMKDDYQWLTFTGGYAVDSWWLPSARLGFSKNITGSQLSYVNAGVTVMKFLNIDIASTLDTVKIDGNELMRGLSIRLGVQFDY